VKGAFIYYKDMSITMTEEFKNRTNNLLMQQDSIETFITRLIKVTKNKNDSCRKNELFENYKTFCNSNSQRCQPTTSLWQRLGQMQNIGVTTSVLNGYDVYRGLIISETETDNKNDSYEESFYNDDE
jgi:hypothetical protein